MRINGTFNGTGAALTLGIGFVPDWVKIYNLEDGDLASLEWNRNMQRAAEVEEGIRQVASGGAVQIAALTHGNGIVLYQGGDKLAAASTTYLLRKSVDRRASGTAGTIVTWTSTTPASRTGNFDKNISTSYVGEGSRVLIDSKDGKGPQWYTITALSNDGDAADDVTLNQLAGSGDVLFIGTMYDFIGGVAGDIIPAGFTLNATSVINVSGEMCAFEAGTWDN